MDSINSWLDVKELNRLAKALMEPVAKGDLATKTQAVKSTSEMAIPSSASKALAEASAVAKRSGLIPAKSAVRQPALPELGEWLTKNAQCIGICVVDHDGDVLHERMPNPEWTGLTRSTALTLLHDKQVTSVRYKVNAQAYLQFVGVRTERGTLLIGLLTRNLLNDKQRAEFSQLVEKISAGSQVEQR